jgi:protein N-terminal glutamine amidohydrolase
VAQGQDEEEQEGEAPIVSLDPRSFDYQPFYCEENVARLVATPPADGPWHALFITNEKRAVALWSQKLTVGDAPVVWDYHVVALQVGRDAAWVFDLDSTLAFPIELPRYLERTFRPLPREHADLAPRFRLVAAAELARTFASDRRHMRTPDGAWLKPPPPWPAIGTGHTLGRYLDLDDPIAGDVLDLGELLKAGGRG